MKNLADLRRWRDSLSIDDPILLRDGRTGIVSHVSDDRFTVLWGKGHECKVKREDIFPTDWLELILEWMTKKARRGPDLPLRPE